MRTSLPRSPLIALMLAMALALGACTDGRSETKTVNDSTGTFHFVVPSDWSTRSGKGVVAAYDGEAIPAGDDARLGGLLVLAYSAKPEKAKSDRLIVTLAKARAKSRKWNDVTYGEPVKTTLGGRDAVMLDVSGSSANGAKFDGRLVLSRQRTVDVLVFGVAPRGKLAQSSLNSLMADDWFWHVAQVEKKS
ncbi:MAG: hypothetical protein HY876_02405 [Coriobacteriales bacterium]|nr:hypothetical protein [Coriobacteriales bacterium]